MMSWTSLLACPFVRELFCILVTADDACVCVSVYIYVCVCLYIYIYIDIYMENVRDTVLVAVT